MANFLDLALESSMRFWTLTGPDAVVKVVSLVDATGPDEPVAKGYFTQAKFLNGLNSLAIERDLGLRPQSMVRGGFVCYFSRLPRFKEVVYRYAAAMPDGRVWDDAMHAELDQARETYRHQGSVVDYYPPGSPKILQWELKEGVTIPFAAARQFVSPIFEFKVSA